ncbi:bacteriocin fulvocin C-related protein [Sphaerimonospora mesophila]|uniref:bacteriocin fulvocin C-related protein n=1 Tax=Sphaerimonospora mesophila TaxID=37483 RepID=UPI000B309DC9
MRKRTTARWVLAFDAGCAHCQRIAEAVKSSSHRGIEVLPLMHPDVRAWREQALGENPVWAPTLIKVEEARIRAWVGSQMSLRLLMRIGLPASIRLLGALKGIYADTGTSSSGRFGEMDRKRFLKLGAGLGAALGLAVTGAIPAHAESGDAQLAAWLQANKHRLPREYNTFSNYSMSYRRAIFGELSPADRSRLWVEHVRRYRSTHQETLSPAQDEVLSRAEEIFSNEATFAGRPRTSDPQLDSLKEAALAAFGPEETRLLLITLGPAEDPPHDTELRKPKCHCFTPDPVECPGSCFSGGCDWQFGCGPGWMYQCNGLCIAAPSTNSSPTS